MVCKFKQKIIYSRASSATFAGYDVEKILDETIDMEIITFGSPRFCNKEFSIFVYSRICEIWSPHPHLTQFFLPSSTRKNGKQNI